MHRPPLTTSRRPGTGSTKELVRTSAALSVPDDMRAAARSCLPDPAAAGRHRVGEGWFARDRAQVQTSGASAR